MTFTEKLGRIIMPQCCVFCGDVITNGYVCRHCSGILKKEQDILCPECAHHLRECTCAPPDGIDALIPVFWYTGILHEYIHTLKNKRYLEVIEYISSLMAPFIGGCGAFANCDAITYIPRERKKALRLGTDQAYEIARCISEYTGIPMLNALVCRGKKTDQKLLDAGMRAENIKGVFSITEEAVIPKRLILIDDIVTTGSTLSEAARVLRLSGASHIAVLCAAKTLYGDDAPRT